MEERIKLEPGEVAFLENGQTKMIMDIDTAIYYRLKMDLLRRAASADMYNDIKRSVFAAMMESFNQNKNPEKSPEKTPENSQEKTPEISQEKIDKLAGPMSDDIPVFSCKIKPNPCGGRTARALTFKELSEYKNTEVKRYDSFTIVYYPNGENYEPVIFESAADADRFLSDRYGDFGCSKGAVWKILSGKQNVTRIQKLEGRYDLPVTAVEVFRTDLLSDRGKKTFNSKVKGMIEKIKAALDDPDDFNYKYRTI